MPVDMKRYPSNWKQISRFIRFERAGFRCECFGECGLDHSGRCDAWHGLPNPITGSNVVLTTAHLGVDRVDGSEGDKHDKMDVRHENLKAMCQGCHLRLDIDEHKQNRANNKREKQIRAGQIPLDI